MVAMECARKKILGKVRRLPWLFTKHTKPEPFVGPDPTPAGSREAPSSLSCISLYTSAHKQHSLESVVARGALFNEMAARVQPLRTLSAPGGAPIPLHQGFTPTPGS